MRVEGLEPSRNKSEGFESTASAIPPYPQIQIFIKNNRKN